MWKRIKETILYYVVNWWYFSKIYDKFAIPILWFDKDIDKYCETKEEAIDMMSRRKYHNVSKKYMMRKINEKFE